MKPLSRRIRLIIKSQMILIPNTGRRYPTCTGMESIAYFQDFRSFGCAIEEVDDSFGRIRLGQSGLLIGWFIHIMVTFAQIRHAVKPGKSCERTSLQGVVQGSCARCHTCKVCGRNRRERSANTFDENVLFLVLTNNANARNNTNKPVNKMGATTISFSDSPTVQFIPKRTMSMLDDMFYDDEELANFRHESFLEKAFIYEENCSDDEDVVSVSEEGASHSCQNYVSWLSGSSNNSNKTSTDIKFPL
jgi:hypothetical protein